LRISPYITLEDGREEEMISLMDSMCFAAYTCCLEELAEGTTMILFQERFMRVAKRTNKQSIQGMDFISQSSILWSRVFALWM
jgi:hypothetical protein